MTTGDPNSQAALLEINSVCNWFEEQWKAGSPPTIEEVLLQADPRLREILLPELISLEVDYRRLVGQPVDVESLYKRFPQVDPEWFVRLFHSFAFESTHACSTSSQDAIEQDLPRQLGDYVLEELIATGGMGSVYRAVHQHMQRTVAVKILHNNGKADQASRVERFRRELRAAGKLSHSNIVTAHDGGVEVGLCYLVTEYLEGSDLNTLVKRRGPLSVEQAVDFVRQAAQGLEYAHQHNVIHRDIKPSNLIATVEGPELPDSRACVKVLDLGLARMALDESVSLTNSNVFMGTLAFVAPEQARNPRNADERADVYSLGCTLFYLLSGKTIRSPSDQLSVFLNPQDAPIPSLTEIASVPQALDDVFQKMVATSPDQRYQSMADLIADLEPFGPTAIKPKWQTTMVWGIALVAAIIVTLLLGVSFLKNGPVVKENDASGWALSFDGAQSRVVSSSPGPPPQAVTLEAIVTLQGKQASSIIGWTHGEDHVALFHTDDQWGVGRRTEDRDDRGIRYVSLTRESQRESELGTTVHLAAVFDGNSMQLFVDGQAELLDELDYEFQLGPRNQVSIGGVPDAFDADAPGFFFKGLIHAIRITQGARYQLDFAPPSSFSASHRAGELVIYQMDSGEGLVVRDLSEHGHDGEIIEAEWIRR